MGFIVKKRGCLKCKISSLLHEGVDVRTDVLFTDDLLRTKLSFMNSLHITHSAPLHALRAGVNSAIIQCSGKPLKVMTADE